MAIYEIMKDCLQAMNETSFGEAGVKEREDLQRLLRNNIAIVSPGTLIISEEFSEWADSNRRIDLLGVGEDGALVVIELKRTVDGGHMDLQALRYAAMVSTMTFDRAVDVYRAYLQRHGSDADPQSELLKHLGWEEPDEEEFGYGVRILLVSAEFSKELTTTVLWLNERGLDIRCTRLKPYKDGVRILVDVQPIIPLPEAEDYRVRWKEKQQKEQAAKKQSSDRITFNVAIGPETYESLAKRRAILTVVRHLCSKGHAPEEIAEAVPWRKDSMFIVADGSLSSEAFLQWQHADYTQRGTYFKDVWFFCDDDDLIHYNGKTYACSRRWRERTAEALGLLRDRYPEEAINFEASP